MRAQVSAAVSNLTTVVMESSDRIVFLDLNAPANPGALTLRVARLLAWLSSMASRVFRDRVRCADERQMLAR